FPDPPPWGARLALGPLSVILAPSQNSHFRGTLPGAQDLSIKMFEVFRYRIVYEFSLSHVMSAGQGVDGQTPLWYFSFSDAVPRPKSLT
ncbi:MAG: hypothetical protein ACK56F_04420, partial [bacterium]